MSGPKLMELRRMRAARERQRDHDRCAGFGSEYARLLEELNEWAARLARLCVPATENARALESVRAEVDALLLQGSHHEAARIFGEAVAGLRGLVERRQDQFQQRMVNLQNRHQQWLRDCEALAAGQSQLAERLSTAVPSSWPEPEKRRLRELATLKGVTQSAPAEFPGDPEKIAGFERAEAEARTGLAALQTARQQFEGELSATHERLLTRSMAGNAPATASLAEVLQRLAPSPSPAAAEQAEIDRLLADLAVMGEDDFLQDARQQAAKLGREPDLARRRMLTQALLIDGGARLRTLRERVSRREEARQLIDAAAHLKDPIVTGVVAELRRMLASDHLAELETLKPRLQAAIIAAEARREREYKRRALIDALKGLGYETNQGLETAFVEDGRLVLRRPGEDEYAVEMVVNPDLSQLQTALVRYAPNEELTEQQRRRDREREESWCQDHTRLREQMAAQGLESAFKMQLKPGEHPVKILVDANRAAALERRLAEEQPATRLKTQG